MQSNLGNSICGWVRANWAKTGYQSRINNMEREREREKGKKNFERLTNGSLVGSLSTELGGSWSDWWASLRHSSWPLRPGIGKMSFLFLTPLLFLSAFGDSTQDEWGRDKTFWRTLLKGSCHVFHSDTQYQFRRRKERSTPYLKGSFEMAPRSSDDAGKKWLSSAREVITKLFHLISWSSEELKNWFMSCILTRLAEHVSCPWEYSDPREQLKGEIRAPAWLFKLSVPFRCQTIFQNRRRKRQSLFLFSSILCPSCHVSIRQPMALQRETARRVTQLAGRALAEEI